MKTGVTSLKRQYGNYKPHVLRLRRRDLGRVIVCEIEKFFNNGCDDYVISNIATIKLLLRRTLVRFVLRSTVD